MITKKHLHCLFKKHLAHDNSGEPVVMNSETQLLLFLVHGVLTQARRSTEAESSNGERECMHGHSGDSN